LIGKPGRPSPLGFPVLGVIVVRKQRFFAFSAILLLCACHQDDGPPQALVPPSRATVAADPRIDSLRAEIRTLAGRAPYIVIDRSRNLLSLRQPHAILLASSCATGSGKLLFGAKKNQTWHFQTPRRVFSVTKKVKDPIWKKPLWAFVEKNEQAPVLPWEFNRLDGTTLGSFALELEDSYAIHGTLYPNLLGRSITHGCVRLNDEDLAAAYAHAEIGTQVYVF
jgi:L,D-transpeptidase ErfK/SrfK